MTTPRRPQCTTTRLRHDTHLAIAAHIERITRATGIRPPFAAVIDALVRAGLAAAPSMPGAPPGAGDRI